MKKNLTVITFLCTMIFTTCLWAEPNCQEIFGPKAKINLKQDKTDLTFTDDAQLKGYWVSVDFVKNPKDFVPGKKSFEKELFLKEMIFLPNGDILNSGSKWTKEHILNHNDKTDSAYQIKKIDGKNYLFMEWKSGDYVCLGKKPSFYVLRKEANLRMDNTDLPFEKDSQAIGKWKAIDFVFEQEDFNPNEKYWKGDLYLKTLTLQPKGQTPMSPAITWTKGHILHHTDKTDSAYTIKRIDGKDYMFFEWKSGDYTFRGKKPAYYVLEKM